MGRDGYSSWKLQNNSGELKCVSCGACTFVLKSQQKWTFPDEMYRDSTLLVTICLGGLFGCGGGVWEWWVPGTGSHCHSKLPGLQPAPSHLREIPWGKGPGQDKPEKWEIELFCLHDFPLAGWEPKRAVDVWEFILVPVCVLKQNFCGLCAT